MLKPLGEMNITAPEGAPKNTRGPNKPKADEIMDLLESQKNVAKEAKGTLECASSPRAPRTRHPLTHASYYFIQQKSRFSRL